MQSFTRDANAGLREFAVQQARWYLLSSIVY
jgi:hypothetical protein